MTTNHNDNESILFAGQEAQEAPQGKTVLPVLPISEVVLFPRLIMPLALWEEPAQKLVDEVLLTGQNPGIFDQPGGEVHGVSTRTISSTSAPPRSS